MSTWKKIPNSGEGWELSGESVLNADSFLDKSGATTIRLTHSNVYCPIDGVNLSVRIGDANAPTEWDKAESRDDWISPVLVEELLEIDDVEVERSTVTTPIDMEEETPWDATYEVNFELAKGTHRIEIRVESQDEYFMSGVLSDWEVEV